MINPRTKSLNSNVNKQTLIINASNGYNRGLSHDIAKQPLYPKKIISYLRLIFLQYVNIFKHQSTM